ncbi:maltose epimerase-like [Bradysia coprophila]|uniref:maltose epimerase-like n=1 Tax=Bradysia coprophila TaxID=38358 RepID=UPI00187D9FFE|nr:maltose epimerase-like [Bradysia coprophila]
MRKLTHSPSVMLCDHSKQNSCDCGEQEFTIGSVSLRKTIFGFVRNKYSGETEPVSKFTWQNKNSMLVSVMTYGATVLSIQVPNRKVESEDIILGFDTLDDYIEANQYNFNCLLGRVAGATKNSETKQNEFLGLSNVNWIPSVDGVTLVLSYLSSSDDGCPGNLFANVMFHITEDNRFVITYQASVDTKMPVDLSHRLYFNLAGHSAGPIELMKHVFHMNCNKVIREKGSKTDKNNSIGKFADIGSTNNDLRVPQLVIVALSKIGPIDYSPYFSINSYDQQLAKQFVGQFIHRQSGRAMEIYTDQKCVTFSACDNFPGAHLVCKMDLESITVPSMYKENLNKTRNQRTSSSSISKQVISKMLGEVLDKVEKDDTVPKINGKGSSKYRKNSGFYIQCQNYPNAMHHGSDILLNPSDFYAKQIEYKFGLCGA